MSVLFVVHAEALEDGLQELSGCSALLTKSLQCKNFVISSRKEPNEEKQHVFTFIVSSVDMVS